MGVTLHTVTDMQVAIGGSSLAHSLKGLHAWLDIYA